MKALITALMTAVMSSTAVAQTLLPYQNPEFSPEERALDLVQRLTLEEKARLMMSDSEAIPEYGIARYNWWNEALHGAARSGLATVFPQAVGMAASWNPTLLQKMMSVASTEQRIKFIEARKEGNGVARYAGLTVWTPNINIFRDPRWGRGQETYGEDPYLTREMGYAAVTGLQGTNEGKVYGTDPNARPYDKLHACLKHYAVHSGPEYERHVFDAKDISQRDLGETYLYAFEYLVKNTDVHEVMCAYNAFEGKPCCGSDQLLTQILRNEWGYKGMIVSDCWAIRDFYDGRPGYHNIFENAAQASANAVLSGTDVNCGSSYASLPEAVRTGAIKEEDIDISVVRLLTDRFRLGEMDPDDQVSWNKIPTSLLACDDHAKVALDMSRQSMTLLKNNGVLPLSQEKPLKVLLIGPNANDSVTQWGNYYGTARHTITLKDALEQRLGNNVTYMPGCHWAKETVFTSLISSNCKTADGKPGFDVTYWNQPDRKGEPVVKTTYSRNWQLCTSGATVFAVGVNLEGFSALYTTTFTAPETTDITLDGFTNGRGCYIINGDTIQTFKNNHGARPAQTSYHVVKGKKYQIQIPFDCTNGDAQINFDLGYDKKVSYAEVTRAAKKADVVIYCGGISPRLEGEEMKVPYEGFKGGDRTNIQLPAVQRKMIQALNKSGKPVVFVMMNGSALGITPEVASCSAILEAWYPGQAGGQAITDVLMGDYNPAGRLPITFYNNDEELPDFHDYNMPGHTYRYFKGAPLFAFGYGLSYSKFIYSNAKVRNNGGVSVTVTVTNDSDRDGEEVVQVYMKRDDDADGPLKTLRAFKRVMIPAHQSLTVTLPVTDMRTFNTETMQMEEMAGKAHTLYVGSSSRDEDLSVLNFTL